MSETSGLTGHFASVAANLYDILGDHKEALEETGREGSWQRRVSRRRVFYVRGFTTFVEHVLDRSQKSLGELLTDELRNKELKELLRLRTEWLKTPFNWERELHNPKIFSGAQFRAAAREGKKKEAAIFVKGVMVVATCELLTKHIKKDVPDIHTPEHVYDYMRLEPALSTVSGLDSRSQLQRLFDEIPDLASNLRKETKHARNHVFFEIADGHTVTNNLASKVADVLNRHVDRHGNPDGPSTTRFGVELDLDSSQVARSEVIA